MTQGKVYGWSNFLKFAAVTRLFFVFVLQCYTQREHVHTKNLVLVNLIDVYKAKHTYFRDTLDKKRKSLHCISSFLRITQNRILNLGMPE